MDPERYDYENDNADDYSQDDWYYQRGMPGGEALDDEDDEWDDELYDDQEDIEE